MKKKYLFDKLLTFNQEHLLSFYNELSLKEKFFLKRDIKKIDFKMINDLYESSFSKIIMDMKKVSNLKCISNLTDETGKVYEEIGKKTVKNKEYAIIIMAGGNASRLGLNGPKGCFELNINNKNISLFEIFISQLKKVYDDLGVYINLYIMTSNSNYRKTVDFLKSKNFFGYPKKHISFFRQHDLPILNEDGKILLKDKYKVLFGPNGNGDVFHSLRRSNIINKMKKKNIKYVLFSTVDNVLTNLIDFKFIGAMIHNNYGISTKTLLKEKEDDKNWVFCKYNNRPYMLPSLYIDKDITNKKGEDGDYIYRDTNITYHLLSMNEIEKLSKIDLKYHRAFRKTPYLDLKGNFITPTEPNSYKFEKFIFDAFYFSKNMLLYRTTVKEFCPIKNSNDVEKATKELEKRFK